MTASKKGDIRVSAIILTLNEEGIIEDCIKALDWCDSVHVVDSGSSDKTVELTLGMGASVYRNRFESFATQRNWALDNCKIESEWILFIDADEISSSNFRDSLLEKCQEAGGEVAGFYCCSRLMIDGSWIKRSVGFPVWQYRVLRRGRGRFVDSGHGQKEGNFDGVLKYIDEPFDHFAYYKGWSDWIAKHNEYSNKEAVSRSKKVDSNLIDFRHSSQRNILLKNWLSKVMIWPLIRFFYSYIFRLGFLEGSAGFVFAVNMAWYEYLIILKIKEIERTDNDR